MPSSPPFPPWLRVRATEVSLAVRLQPRATRNEILGEHGGMLRVRVTAPPVDAAANRALIDLLARELDCARGQILLARGHTSRQKTVVVRGLPVEAIVQRLAR